MSGIWIPTVSNFHFFFRINVTTHHSDFKELVPEFYMPENKVSKLGQIGVAIFFDALVLRPFGQKSDDS